jgi:hypothetical protein
VLKRARLQLVCQMHWQHARLVSRSVSVSGHLTPPTGAN